VVDVTLRPQFDPLANYAKLGDGVGAQSMTLTVIVPNEGDEASLQEQGITKAKDLALQFAADRE
jgi:hypothetical protein